MKFFFNRFAFIKNWKIVHIILDMSYEQFSYQAEQKSWTFNEHLT